jgi:sialate O-acetylesterase
VRFRHANGGLKINSSNRNNFVIAGADRIWHPVQARVENDSLVFSSPDVPLPVAVRYAWAADPACTLYNGAGLPASPFRTDDWPIPPF